MWHRTFNVLKTTENKWLSLSQRSRQCFFLLSLVDCCAAPKNNRLNKNIKYLPLLYLRFEQKASDRVINSYPYEISRNFIFCLPFQKKNVCIKAKRNRPLLHPKIGLFVAFVKLEWVFNWNSDCMLSPFICHFFSLCPEIWQKWSYFVHE